MRLGAPVFLQTKDPEALARAHVALGYRAAYCPDFLSLDDLAQVRAVEKAFAQADVCIAEVGAWCNPLDKDPAKAKANRQYIAQRLALADEVGARCCVNILGSFCETGRWDGPSFDAYDETFFQASVDAYREILDAVKPKRSFMTFETMPYYFLDGPEEYLRLLRAIDRPGAAVHLDVCNCVNSPRVYVQNAELISRCFRLLSGKIRSCHLKDIKLADDEGCTAVFREVQPGSGKLDLARLLSCAKREEDLPVMLEHLPAEQNYLDARDHVLDLLGDLA